MCDPGSFHESGRREQYESISGQFSQGIQYLVYGKGKKMTTLFYKTYEEIPIPIKEYIVTVAEAKTIQEIPLVDINEFLTGLQEYDKITMENDGGWVI